jgi:ribonuclease PH
LLEVQGTAEKKPFTPDQLHAMVALAQKGARELHAVQRAALEKAAASERPARG